MHAGEVDVLVGTQMIAKGHDFQRVSLVVVLNPDGQLASHDFRAPERLFATLMQVSGRAGRSGLPSRVLVQTRFASHRIVRRTRAARLRAVCQAQLAEREAARMPPITHQALLTAEAGRWMRRSSSCDAARDQALGNCARGRITHASVRSSADVVAAAGWRVACAIAGRGGPAHAIARAAGCWLAALPRKTHAMRWNIEVDPLEL